MTEIFNVQRIAPVHFAVEKAFTVWVAFERFEPVRLERAMTAVWLI
jgi:hypothetical protein